MRISTIEGNHLIGLDTREALMLVRLLHSARLHGPTAEQMQRDGDARRFTEQLSGTLMRHLGQRVDPGPGAIGASAVETAQKNSFGSG